MVLSKSKSPAVETILSQTRPNPERPTDLIRGFRQFISDYGVAPLAIGVVIGTAVNDLVKTLVDGFVSPLIGLFSPQTKLQSFTFTFHQSVFKVGAIINATLSFLIIAWLVYIIAKLVLRNDDLLKKK
jgi:large conductance mechanosensitive channel